jgi:hypothetical protein
LESNKLLVQKWHAVVAKYSNAVNKAPTPKPIQQQQQQKTPTKRPSGIISSSKKSSTSNILLKKQNSAPISRNEDEKQQLKNETITTTTPQIMEIPKQKQKSPSFISNTINFLLTNWNYLLIGLFFWLLISNYFHTNRLENQLQTFQNQFDHSEQKFTSLAILFEKFVETQGNNIDQNLKEELQSLISESGIGYSLKRLEKEIKFLDQQLLERKELVNKIKERNLEKKVIQPMKAGNSDQNNNNKNNNNNNNAEL